MTLAGREPSNMTIHLSALLAALALTFHPDTNRWFRR